VTVTAIVNPVSGGGRVKKHLPVILAELAKRFGPVELLTTRSRGDGRVLARQAADAGSDFLVAIGGDGTISECVDGILSSSRPDMPLAVIPAGTGSDFSRNLLVGRSPSEWISRITFPRTQAIDAGAIRMADGTMVHVVNVASFGVSGAIAAAVNRRPRSRFLPGRLVFFLHSLIGIIRFRPIRVRIAIDGEPPRERDVALVAIANGPVFGGGMRVAPDARMDDGLLDVIIIEAMPALKLLMLFPLIYSGRHIRHAKVTCLRAKSLEASLAGDAAMWDGAIEVDGESVGHLPAGFSIVPAGLVMAMALRT
jgi:YegS/Rv2252/BmrU family lipid kinase